MAKSKSKSKRDLSRILARPIPLEAKAALSRKLKTISTEKEKDYSKKYKMVIFFETKKTRKLIKANPSDLNLNLNLLYCLHFPVFLKYVSLYPKSEDNVTKKAKEIQQTVLNVIKKAVEDGRINEDFKITRQDIKPTEIKQEHQEEQDDFFIE